jgi:hypothetical protein
MPFTYTDWEGNEVTIPDTVRTREDQFWFDLTLDLEAEVTKQIDLEILEDLRAQMPELLERVMVELNGD